MLLYISCHQRDHLLFLTKLEQGVKIEVKHIVISLFCVIIVSYPIRVGIDEQPVLTMTILYTKSICTLDITNNYLCSFPVTCSYTLHKLGHDNNNKTSIKSIVS